MFRHQLPAYSPLKVGPSLAAILTDRATAEAELTALLRGRYRAESVTLCGSGTHALSLALLDGQSPGPAHAPGSAPSAGSRVGGAKGPLVALPAYGCFDLVSAAVGAEARIVFYDLDPRTLGPEGESLRAVCALGPEYVVVAPLYGIPIDWEEVASIVRPSGARLIEDAAQGSGAQWRGVPLGGLGDCSVLSFGRGKGWTGGAGGALLRRGKEAARSDPNGLAAPARASGILARNAAQWLLGRPSLYWIPAALPILSLGETVYHPPSPVRLMAPLAIAFTLRHAAAADEEASVRRSNAASLRDRIREAVSGAVLPTVPEGGEAGWLRLPIVMEHRISSLRHGAAAARSAGIMPGYPHPLADLAAARVRTVAGPAAPGAKLLAERLVTLPTHSLVKEREYDELVKFLTT